MDQQTPQPKSSNLWWGLGALAVIVVGYLVLSQKPTTPSTTLPTPAKPEVVVKTENTPYNLGVIFPLTGDMATAGLPMQKAVKLAVDRLNAQAGTGKKINVIFEDGKCNGEDAATAAQKLINIDHVSAIIGGTCSGETLGFAPIANEKKVIVISPSATSPDISTKGGPYIYRFAPSDALAGKVAAAYAINDLNFKRAAVISENTDYAQGLRKTFVTSFKLLGGEVVVDEAYNTGVTDFRTQALKIKNANVDVIYVIPQSAAPGLNILKALSDQQIKAKRLTAEAMLSRDAAKENANVMEGLVGFEAFFQEDAPAAQEFIQAYKDVYHEELAYPFYMSNSYSEVFLLKDLLDKNNGDTEKVRDALDRLKHWTGGSSSDVSLDESGDIQWRTYAVKEVKDGKIDSVRTFTLE